MGYEISRGNVAVLKQHSSHKTTMLYVDFIENVLTRADHTKQLVVCGVDLEKFAPLKKPVSYSGAYRLQWYL